MHSFYDSLAAALADQFFRGWLFLNIGGFPHSNPDSAASIRPRSNYEFFFLDIRSSSTCALLIVFISADFGNPANW